MTELILIRHGETDWNRELRFQGHVDVPLNATGLEQARHVAQRLLAERFGVEHLVCSDLLRTRQTADALQRRCRLMPELGPEGTVDGLLHCTRWPDAREPMLVVGHQAALGLTAAYLLAGVLQPWPIRNGAVWWLRRRLPCLRCRSWR